MNDSSIHTWPGGSIAGQSTRQRRPSDGADYRNKLPMFYVDDMAMANMLDDQESMEKKVVVGICAMAKKSNSKPMKEIIKRLENFARLQVLIFEEDVILKHPVEDWPIVNAFISFFSSGFPLDKAIAYKNLRHPFVVNDLEMQNILQDRTEVYRILAENNIPHPRYAVLNKAKDPLCRVVETEDSIEINGKTHVKPFVEKPIDAEDHNIYIYFPQSAGGGSTRLFRKGLQRLPGCSDVKDRSSVYSAHTSRVRRNGAYLYEDFMPTDGTDVKVYTVGSDYQHAEARKSPCLDGKVERDQDGKEIRYPVLLSAREKLIARKVVWAFGQNVCGFDLLRANGMCYVCDVNGFSFVKTSSKYYDDCARILGTMMLREVCPTLHIPFPVGPAPEDIPVVPTTSGQMMELRCVVALIRHGDRTPKQKMKMEVKNKMFFELFEKYGGFKSGHLKLKRPKQLQEVLDIVRQLLNTDSVCTDPDLQDKMTKLQQMKLVLEMYGHFSGINRKVQLKYQPHGRPKRSSSEEEEVSPPQGAPSQGLEPLTPCPAEAQAGGGPLDDTPRDPSLLMILKWGGELTPAGRIQAENLGKAFRTLYPGGQGKQDIRDEKCQFEAPGLGLLRLHSTFRHDLKIYASDEGRVQMTAAAFTKGLLALEGELTPILVQMVKSANTNGLLDGEGKTSKSQLVVKEKLKSVFNQDRDFTEISSFKLNPTNTLALTNAMDFVKNPQDMCKHVHTMIREITAKIRALKAELKTRDLPLYNGESWELLIRRWAKLEKDFRLKNGQFEISKIPDIYDCIKYDLQHNQKTLQYERANELFMCSKALADIIIPQEYGITVDEKLHIAQNYCLSFLRKIRSDFLQVVNPNMEDATTRLDSRYSKGVASPERFVRTRLYFTSESHIHSMLNMLRYGNLFECCTLQGCALQCASDSQWDRALSFLDATAELNYMSQIVFMLFEDPSKDLHSDERYHMELHFSPGAYTSCDEPTEPRGMGYRPKHCPQRSEKSEGEKAPHTLASAFMGPLPTTSSHFKRGLRLDTTAAAPDLGDISESDMFEQMSTPGVSPESPESLTVTEKSSPDHPKAYTRLPGSPDPNIPEWDWGDDSSGPAADTTDTAAGDDVDTTTCKKGSGHCADEDKAQQGSDTATCPHTEAQMCGSSENPMADQDSVAMGTSPHAASRPINISVSPASSLQLSSKTSLDEKRSRSLEDKNDCPTDNDLTVGRCLSLPLSIHRNYKTVHLPLLHNDMHTRRSLPCVFTMGFLPGAKGACFALPRLLGSASTPDFNSLPARSNGALEGFSYVPQLHPLETLHNTLTFREMDDFLGRITSTRFMQPAISPTLAASRPSLMLISPNKYPQSYPPSSNSSSGPSSPSSAPTPFDFFMRMYMERSEDGQRSDTDSSASTSSSRRDNHMAVSAVATVVRAEETAGKSFEGNSKKSPQREDCPAEGQHCSVKSSCTQTSDCSKGAVTAAHASCATQTAEGSAQPPASVRAGGEGRGFDRAQSGHQEQKGCDPKGCDPKGCDPKDRATCDGKAAEQQQQCRSGSGQRTPPVRTGNRFAVSRISDDAPPPPSPPPSKQKEEDASVT
ncbi:inositol hexakisphosphate and diphosphoinositol-pentakisphosphate kinase 2-like isoform X5 [Babylonia areolata]|uniref:inositol hexakisphosphate and diphosphoinositol-pentakisphosphate kinase 2-like isoform X5 n=1 Tax=Babylonia areolata TaxID=304850 RepID=UPI003FD1339E